MSQGAARTEGARFGQRRRFYTPVKPPPHATRRTRRGPRGVVSSVLGPPPAPPHPLPQPAAPLAPVAGPRGVSRATPQHALVWLAPSLARVALRSVHASCPQDSSFLFAGWSSVLRWRRNSSLSIHPLATSGSFQLLALAGDASVATPCVDTAFHLSWVNTEERSGWVTWQVCVRLSQKPPDRLAKWSSRVHLPTSRVPAFPSSWQGSGPRAHSWHVAGQCRGSPKGAETSPGHRASGVGRTCSIPAPAASLTGAPGSWP